MNFSTKQIKILKYNNLHNPLLTIQEGAVRSGKTFINNFLWWRHICDFIGQGKFFIMTGATIGSLQRNVLNDFEKIFPNVNTTLNKHNEFEMYGNTVACFGTDNITSYKAMKGFTSAGWYANEITEHHRNSVDQAFKRCSENNFRIFWDTNPDSPNNHIKTNYIDKTETRLESGRTYIKSWHFDLEDNSKKNGGVLSDEYIESLKKSTPSGIWYDRDILGLWTSAEGMIYKDFNFDRHTCSYSDIENMKFKEYFGSVDWGYEHLGVLAIYGVDHDGKYYRLEEEAEHHKGIDFWVRLGIEKNEKYKTNMIFYADDARPDNIEEFRKAGLIVREANKAVVEGISYVASLFKTDKLMIVRETNANYLRTIYIYRWKMNTIKEEPVKEDDDSQDTERYALYTKSKGNLIEFLR